MMRELSNEEHDELWRICDGLVRGAGARAAVLVEAASGGLILAVGDAAATGAPDAVEKIGPHERVVRGPSGQMYGVDIPGGVLLGVLHDGPALEAVREAAPAAVKALGKVLSALSGPDHEHAHGTDHDHSQPHEHAPDGSVVPIAQPAKAPRARAAAGKNASAAKAAPKAKKAAATRKAAPSKGATTRKNAAKKPAGRAASSKKAAPPRRKPAGARGGATGARRAKKGPRRKR